jgi:hypothetical protein
MPLTTTFATLSARGFGLFGRQKVLTTVTFPGGTTTWTAPFGVNSLVSLVGKGGDGGPAGSYGTYAYFARAIVVSAGGYNVTIFPIANPFGQTQINTATSIRDTINSGSGLLTINQERTEVFSSIGDNGYNLGNFIDGVLTNVIAGSATFDQRNWYNGDMLLVPGVYLMETRCDIYTPPYNGADTTAFGYTFPGGVEVPATTFTYNNVPVTPGTTYTIVNNGSVTITYYV